MTTPRSTSDTMQFRVTIGVGTPTGDPYESSTSSGASERLVVTIPDEDLTENTQYSYLIETKLNSDSWIVPGTGIEGTFWSKRGAGTDDWKFVIVGDTHIYGVSGPAELNESRLEHAYSLIKEEDPRFLIHIGDNFFMSSNWVTDQATGYLIWEYARNIGSSDRGYYHEYQVIGNHEAEGRYDSSPDDMYWVQRWMTTARKSYWKNPDDGEDTSDAEWIDGRTGDEVGGTLNTTPLENYYKISYGDVDFFVLDGDRYSYLENATGVENNTSLVLGTNQRAWLENALAASTAFTKIVVCHHVLITDYRGGFQRIQDTDDYAGGQLQPVLKANGVSAYIWGHDHKMAHAFWEEVDYIQAGSPTRPFSFDPDTEGYQGGYEAEPLYGYWRGTVTGNSVLLEYVRTEIDSETPDDGTTVVYSIEINRKNKHGIGGQGHGPRRKLSC
jgi:predicted phosphodiesterase